MQTPDLWAHFNGFLVPWAAGGCGEVRTDPISSGLVVIVRTRRTLETFLAVCFQRKSSCRHRGSMVAVLGAKIAKLIFAKPNFDRHNVTQPAYAPEGV